MAGLKINAQLTLPDAVLEERFVRASGPGGQHVNKTSTAVQLRFDVRNNPLLPNGVRARLLKQAGTQITRDGEIVIEARRYRSQERNRADARNRLKALIQRAWQPPKKRKPTRPSKAAKRRRLDAKNKRGRDKRLRRTPGRED